jgi:hypothetical protein
MKGITARGLPKPVMRYGFQVGDFSWQVGLRRNVVADDHQSAVVPGDDLYDEADVVAGSSVDVAADAARQALSQRVVLLSIKDAAKDSASGRHQ